MRILILGGDLKELLTATRLARKAGFEEIERFTSLRPAIKRIEQCLRGERPPPNAIVVDLDLGLDSGYDFLRNWRSTWKQASIRIIVWSALGEYHQELCELFHVDAYVSKWDGKAALFKALQQVGGVTPMATVGNSGQI
jgi:DNA-binding response OmpR family regulator